jgi:hypothetical protein
MMYVLKKLIEEEDGDTYAVDVAVSKTLSELEDLRDRCIVFESQHEDDIVVRDHPAGLIGNHFKYLVGPVSYRVTEFTFTEELEENVFEAEIKARMSIETGRVFDLLTRNEDL